MEKNNLGYLKIEDTTYRYTDISSVKNVVELPYSVRILLESIIRKKDDYVYTEEHIKYLKDYINNQNKEIPFAPSRVILQDFTGVPAVVDLTSMGMKMIEETGKNTLTPEIPVDLVIDHSLQVDFWGDEKALEKNKEKEYFRNIERYEFLKWAEENTKGLKIIPPSNGIIHQMNLEYLGKVVMENNGHLYPDTLMGTDSHTTMINGLGILGWGVGGIEAEGAMLGQPSYIPVPKVIGVKLEGKLKEGSTATDLALFITKRLRDYGVVGSFVEYFGEGYETLSLADRATIANMAPEYGATCGYFPVDEKTIEYLLLTGRNKKDVERIKSYYIKNKLFYDKKDDIKYYDTIKIDLDKVVTSLSGPKRPQDIIELSNMKKEFTESLTREAGNRGYGLEKKEIEKEISITLKDGKKCQIKTGAVVIAAITSCTNTSNPSVIIGAGILAKKAFEKGLRVNDYVKTSFTPGSKVVKKYLDNSGLSIYLDKLGFQINGYGCATCIGNSGSLDENLEEEIIKNNILVSSVLSGNRNFEGRIHPVVKANYLGSPPLVVAYAIAGNISVDLYKEPIGVGKDGSDVYLNEIWPSSEEINHYISKYVTSEIFSEIYKNSSFGDDKWESIKSEKTKDFKFKDDSTYIKNPPFFNDLYGDVTKDIKKEMKILAVFGDSVTTDHISPAGNIGENTPAGRYLSEKGLGRSDFNTYGSRRGNHEVMMRGTFANIRIRNKMVPKTEGGFTKYYPENKEMTIFEACEKYREDGCGLIVFAGKDYGMGSSRDWAAKGPKLLGVRIVVAESYERIHRSNLSMMGILPLQFIKGDTVDSLKIKGDEIIKIIDPDKIRPKSIIRIEIKDSNGRIREVELKVRLDSPVEYEYFLNGGILPMVLKNKINK